MRIPPKLVVPLVFLVAALYCLLAAGWTATFIEKRSRNAVTAAMVASGHDWTHVRSDGLQVTLSGTAPTEALRFRALSVAGGVVDAGRVIDAMQVNPAQALKVPDFSVEILRNDEGISLIGLIPDDAAREALVAAAETLAAGHVTDMVETSDHPVPGGWTDALGFGLEALALLPRSKISIAPNKVSVTAISDSAAEKRRLEGQLSRKAVPGLKLALNISAPRPVITPFTLRFLIDGAGARFDACSADSDEARVAILAAAAAAGASSGDCTIGLGVPSPDWAGAVATGIGALAELGAGSVTFSDADVSLIAADSVSQSDFDRITGELEADLPEVFSLHAVLTEKPEETAGPQGTPEFSATLDDEGRVQLRGRVTDERTRAAVESFAHSRFGAGDVYAATRLDPALPEGWPIRALAALDALAALETGAVTVRPDLVSVTGVTGDQGASAAVARLLSEKLGDAEEFSIDIRYEPKLDPTLGLPTAAECVTLINAAMDGAKITFEPGSGTISAGASDTLDEIAGLMKNCTDFPMEIGGHTDSQGREEMNLSLSQARAEAVVEALLSRRVLTGHLTARGFGETKPIADNDTEAGREANRRIEFRLIETAEAEAASQTGATEEAEMAAEEAAADGGADDGADDGSDDGAAAPDAAAPDDTGSGDGDPEAGETE